MDIMKSVKKFLGVQPISVGDLNRQATRGVGSAESECIAKSALDGITVTEEYKMVRNLLEMGCPLVLVSGNAGTGKSTLIHYLRKVLNKRTAVVAPTGVAALNVEGVTIHSFFHLPPKIHEDDDIRLVYDRKLYHKLELLIVDEISMVRCDVMDSIDKFLRKNREIDLPFGGVQLLLVGDLFQLPPVAPRHEWDVLRAKGYASPYFFSAFSLQKTSVVPVELEYVYRQQDASFIDLLNQIRVAENLNSAIEEVNRQCFRNAARLPDITLTCTNKEADHINMKELQRIASPEYSFLGKIEGDFSLEKDKLPSPYDLRLTVGSHVMFTKNGSRWVNGTLGIVQHLDQGEHGPIRAQLITGERGSVVDVPRVTWENYRYEYDSKKDQIVAKKVGQYIQYPLMLGWAVTIHKSQGKTLEKVLVDLGHGAFASGQVYVALSRCRSIGDVSLARAIRTTDIVCDSIVKEFYRALKEMKKEGKVESGLPVDGRLPGPSEAFGSSETHSASPRQMIYSSTSLIVCASCGRTNRVRPHAPDELPRCGACGVSLDREGMAPYLERDLEQVSDAWQRWRKEGIGASDAPIAMGVSPWISVDDLIRIKTGEVEEPPATGAMLRGKAQEETARRAYVKQVGIAVRPACVESRVREWMRASLDGLAEKGQRVVEIKCPGVRDHTLALQRRVPEHYYPQLQHILAVTGFSKIDYWSFQDGRGVLLEVQRDDAYIGTLISTEERLWREVKSRRSARRV